MTLLVQGKYAEEIACAAGCPKLYTERYPANFLMHNKLGLESNPKIVINQDTCMALSTEQKRYKKNALFTCTVCLLSGVKDTFITHINKIINNEFQECTGGARLMSNAAHLKAYNMKCPEMDRIRINPLAPPVVAQSSGGGNPLFAKWFEEEYPPYVVNKTYDHVEKFIPAKVTDKIKGCQI